MNMTMLYFPEYKNKSLSKTIYFLHFCQIHKCKIKDKAAMICFLSYGICMEGCYNIHVIINI